MARAIGAKAYKECSSLRNDGVDDIFELATRQAMLVRTPASHHLPASSGNGSGGGGVLHAEKGDRRKSSYGAYDSPKGWSATSRNEGKTCCVIV